MNAAREAGAQIVKEAQSTFYGGYAGYFQDPDGHLWEVVWNPQMLREDLLTRWIASGTPTGIDAR